MPTPGRNFGMIKDYLCPERHIDAVTGQEFWND